MDHDARVEWCVYAAICRYAEEEVRMDWIKVRNELEEIRVKAIMASDCLGNGDSTGVEENLRLIEKAIAEIRWEQRPPNQLDITWASRRSGRP